LLGQAAAVVVVLSERNSDEANEEEKELHIVFVIRGPCGRIQQKTY
jgi:hypothetical protein